jgi:hypothetical protein
MVQMMKRSRKQRTEAAIGYALERRWDLAADENRSLLAEFPDDIEAANRLGKALTELGELDAAAEAYRRSLAIDGSNVIARRNLTRIEELQAEAGKTKRPTATGKRPRAAASPAAIRPHSLIEESGKSAEFTLVEPNMQALKRVNAGDPAELIATPRGAAVRSTTGAILGHIEPSAGLRLRRLIEGGNTYAVVIRRVADDATIYVREIARAPGLQDQPSFLPPASSARRRAAAPRAYTKPSIIRYQAGGGDSTDDDGEEPDGGSWGTRGAGADDDEMDEAGFGDASLQDDDADGLGVDDDDDEPMNDRDDEEEM